MRLDFHLFALLLLTSCTDDRCKIDRFYCLQEDKQKEYLERAPDKKLLELSIIDSKLGKPPSSRFLYELEQRGEVRAKVIFFHHAATGIDDTLLDDMTRIFSRSWPVCTDWLAEAPPASVSGIKQSCRRVFGLR